MQLTIFTDISLKSIMYLKQAKRLVTIDEISEELNIPRNHLIKVLNFMVRKTWINSIRGRNGGLLYNNDSDEFKLGDIIMALENRVELLNCSSCKLQYSCHLRNILKEAMISFYNYLNKYKLKDLNNNATSQILEKIILGTL